MGNTRQISFETFRLDVRDERLWRNTKHVPLGHKALAVLSRLLSEPGQLVTKDELLASAWPDTAVGDAVLTTAMCELRLALGDDARTPRFIETVHGRGYRFVARVVEAESVPPPVNLLVGRESEFARLRELYATALQGMRRIAFIAGEAGIGKTALVEAFVSDVAAQRVAVIASGQCIEHYGAGEAYLPILEALGRLGRDPNEPIRDVFREHAPSWLPHLPSLRRGGGTEAAPVTTARMLRELADALEVLTARDPLILVFEDLHWSDTATLEWLAYAARRRDPARLLVLGTYRPLETVLHQHALRRLLPEMRRLPQCAELVLDYLSDGAVEAYVRQRCGEIEQLAELAALVRRRTGGHPLFMSAMLDELVRNRKMRDGDVTAVSNMVPVGVRQFIEHRFDPLSVEDRKILEAASVAGDPFPIAVIAATVAIPDAEIESRCAVWQHDGHFVVSDGAVTWPDGTLTGRYRFRHALYQEVLYADIAPERRTRLHRAIGDRLQRAWGDQAAHIAAELAMHFEEGRDPDRAMYYLAQAARNAVDRSAYAEARTHLERGQNVLQALPQGLQRSRRELELLLLLGRVLAATRGWAVREVEGVFLHAREICEELQDTRALLQVLWGLIGVTFVSADFRKAQILGQQVLGLATELGNPVYGVLGHMEVGGTAFHLGDAATHSGHHFEQAEALYNVKDHRAHIACFGVDMGVFSRSWATHYLWHKGRINGARASSEEALRQARELSHPLSLAVALAYAAMLYQFCRDLRQVNAMAESTIRLCTEQGFPYYLSWAELLLGWSRAAAGEHEQGIAEIRRAIEAMQARAGARLSYYRALLAEACLWASRTDEALESLARGFADIEKTGERWWESELHRLRGELLQLQPERGPGEPEACFHSALRVARAQGAKPLELRAGLSLGRWLRDQGQISEARQVLETVKDTVSEGFDLPDVREAESLLNAFVVLNTTHTRTR